MAVFQLIAPKQSIPDRATTGTWKVPTDEGGDVDDGGRGFFVEDDAGLHGASRTRVPEDFSTITLARTASS
ncbi:MAG: hypothetical protein ABI658_11755 [Acidimicrobiales bacterium]